MSVVGDAVTARACANIALVKYWGKRDPVLNLPAAGSLSLTLAALTTTSTVRFDPARPADALVLDGQALAADHPALARLVEWLDLVRALAGTDARAEVHSRNDFPTAAGLASSASAYASLALAASTAAGLALAPRELSVLARLGSGSAARSIFGGLAEMRPGEAADGHDAYAEPVAAGADWDLRMAIAVVAGAGAKPVSSRDAMEHCAETSPLYAAWLATVDGDLAAARDAIARRDLGALGAIAEASALAMHGAALASRPGIVYWRPATVACLHAVRELRDAGARAHATIDAGPHVKVLTDAEHVEAVADYLRGVAGVGGVLVSGPGGPAELVP